MNRRPIEKRISPFVRISLAPDVFKAIGTIAPIRIAERRPDGRWNVAISGSLKDIIDTARQPGERSSDVLNRLVKK